MRKHFIVLTSISLISSTKESFYLLFLCLFYVGAIPLSVFFFKLGICFIHEIFRVLYVLYFMYVPPTPSLLSVSFVGQKPFILKSHFIIFMPVL